QQQTLARIIPRWRWVMSRIASFAGKESPRSLAGWLSVLAIALMLSITACGGGGGGGGGGTGGGGGGSDDPYDDPNDDPGDGGDGGNGDVTVEPTLASIQENVFTPICTECHTGAGAPHGLRLDEGLAYGNLVNVASAEVPSLMRVSPGDPDNSYLVHKIEGTNTVGGRMPLGGPYLPGDTIAAIRQWITDGAEDTASHNGNATLKAAWPVPDSTLSEAPR